MDQKESEPSSSRQPLSAYEKQCREQVMRLQERCSDLIISENKLGEEVVELLSQLQTANQLIQNQLDREEQLKQRIVNLESEVARRNSIASQLPAIEITFVSEPGPMDPRNRRILSEIVEEAINAAIYKLQQEIEAMEVEEARDATN